MHRRRSVVAAALAVLLALASSATAQDPPTGSLGPITGAALRQGSWSYRATVMRGGDSVVLGERTLTVRDTPARAGQPGWLIVEETRSLGETMTDSLVVERHDLRPVWQMASIGPMRIALRFTGDSVLGSMSAVGGEEVPVALAQEPGLVVNSGMMETLLTLLPLRESWMAEVRQLAPSPMGTIVVPLRLEVTGEETVTVPGGTFAAWVLSVGSVGSTQTMWVAKEGGRLLRIRMSPPQMSDVTYETVYMGGDALPASP